MNDRHSEALKSEQRLCSKEYAGNFLLLLLILMSSVANMVYKAMHVKDLPGLWAARTRLLTEKESLMRREVALSQVVSSRRTSRAAESNYDENNIMRSSSLRSMAPPLLASRR